MESKHVKADSGSVFGRIDIGAQFKATHGPLRRLLDRKNMLSRNTPTLDPVAHRALGLESEFSREGLLAAHDLSGPLDRRFAHKHEFNAQIVTSVNANSGTLAVDTRRVIPDIRKTFWQRLQESFLEQGLPTTGNGIATYLKMSQGSVNRWQRDDGLPELKTVRDLAIRGKVCVEWLLSGRGPKKPLRFDEETQELLKLWSDLNENGRHHVRFAAQSALSVQQQDKPIPAPAHTDDE